MKKFGFSALALIAVLGFATPSSAVVSVTLNQTAPGSDVWEVLLQSDFAIADGAFAVAGTSVFTPNATLPAPFGTCSPAGTALGHQCAGQAGDGLPGGAGVVGATYIAVSGGGDTAGFSLGLNLQTIGTLTATDLTGALGLGDTLADVNGLPGSASAFVGAGVVEWVGTEPFVFRNFTTGAQETASLFVNGEIIPEPSTVVLLGAGLAGLAFLRRRAA